MKIARCVMGKRRFSFDGCEVGCNLLLFGAIGSLSVVLVTWRIVDLRDHHAMLLWMRGSIFADIVVGCLVIALLCAIAGACMLAAIGLGEWIKSKRRR